MIGNTSSSKNNSLSLAISILVKDLNSDDVEVVISILKTLPHISPILTELLMMGNADFGPLVRHQNQSIRRSALDTLATLLFYRKAVLQQYKSFVTTGWELVIDRILDEQQPAVYLSAFNAVSMLFSEITRSVSHSDEFDNGVGRRQQLGIYGDFVCARLVDHFDLLLQRSDHIDLNNRHVAVNTLTYLADTISRAAGVPYWPATDAPKLSQKHKHLTTPQNIVSILVEHFMQLLGVANDALVFAVGKAILNLLLTQHNQHNDTWINPVLTAFVGLLRREGVTLNPLPILLSVMCVLPMLTDDLLLTTLCKIFPSIRSISDSNQRVSYLIRTFELLIERNVATSGKSNLIGPLMQDAYLVLAFQDDTSSFREEVVVSMIASHHNILSKYQQPQTPSSQVNSNNGKINATNLYYLHQIALNISEVCLKCVIWPGERISAIEYCLRFVDWLCRVTLQQQQQQQQNSGAESTTNVESSHSQKLLSLLRTDLLDFIAMIPSDYICLQSIFLVCQHLLKYPSNNKVYEQSDTSLIVNILRRRFLFLDNQPKLMQYNGSVRDMVMGVSQYGRAHPAQLHPMSGFWLGSLECLFLLGANVSSAETLVGRALDDMLTTYASNKAVVSRARFIKNALQGFVASPTLATLAGVDFSYCIPIEMLDSASSLRSATDIFAYECKKAITGLAGVHYGASVRDRPCRDITLVSGYCDPVWIEVSHTAHPTLHTISLSVTVTNVINFAIKNLVVLVGLAGHLEFPHPQTHSKHSIPKLLPEKCYTFELPLSVTGIDLNYVTFSVTYTHPSGMVELDQGITHKQSAQIGGLAPSSNQPQQLSQSSSTSTTTSTLSSSSSNQPSPSTTPSSSQIAITSSSSSQSSPSSSSTQTATSPSAANYASSAASSNLSSSTAPTLSPMVPIETRCTDYVFDWNQFLIPFKYNKHQFLQQWPRYEASLIIDVIFEGQNLDAQLINTCLLSYPLHNVHSTYFDDSNFQFAFSSSTWFNDQFCFILSGVNKIVDGERKEIQGRFEFRSSNSAVLTSFQNIIDLWLQKLPRTTDNFLARLQSPGEISLFSDTNIPQQPSTATSTSSTNELNLLNQWKEKKLSNTETKSTLLSIDQEFY
ncbi:armadillo-like helical domain-containing protein [Cavenderia fasciculata]|uniref:Armadillo-like helical domain-containing protein n=1 Tax=Cavenderia fasciculata TaxID=261658 RepID=F4PQJ9_CACFS|nr:armadillo-like helical domain-containing protein [Cavenderia fasciculata]EGG21166.1 armadillo-like helical domain-containing protein [Cavenderia fasciculata]|eukprot:XP_004359016.1 armadillo-like helical domain-containing protein [Cavenderia fasciculata]